MTYEPWRDRLRALPVIEGELPDPGLDGVDDPMPLVGRWLGDAIAARLPAPHLANLATADTGGRPANRTLIVKDLDGDAVWFSTSRVSGKGRDIEHNPRAALTLVWVALGRQIRIAGAVDAPSADVSADDFLRRHPLARREMLAGDQSAVRGADADERVARAGDELEREPETVDPDWTAYRLRPDTVEFWASRPGDAALRIRFTREDPGWRRERLWT